MKQTKEQLDRIERKLNYLILTASRDDFHRGFTPDYKGWNALSAYKDLMSRPENENYLKDNSI